MSSNPFPLGTPEQQAQSSAALAGLVSSDGILLNDETVNQQPDVNSGGTTFLDGLENTALTDINLLGAVATRNVASGRMPFDPASPLVGKLQNPQPALGGMGLILIALIVWALL